uniref:DNA polymerase n=1 Tax=Peltigera malacea TaxID=52884 RepID=G5CER5_9LECA|nr:DNA polymerase type B2 [Peltigera malacea]AEK48302.1 DNA polymerase type B2 [Peltigera malacea]
MYIYNECIIVNYNPVKKDISTVYHREVYSSNTGVLYFIVEDTVKNLNYPNVFTRKIGNSIFNISSDKITGFEVNKELACISNKHREYKAASNPFIGTLDLETYHDTDGFSKVYALGFYVDGGDPVIFYIEKGESSHSLVLRCFDALLINKYNNYIFYIHNLGGYDGPFILNILRQANLDKGFEYYKLSYLFRDNKLIKLSIKLNVLPVSTVTKDVGSNNNNKSYNKDDQSIKDSNIKITLYDSFKLLNNNLYDLSVDFEVSVTKGSFPHEFVKKDTLFYIGNTPHIDYWKDITKKEYKNKLFKVDLNLKVECINYLKKYLISLYQVLSIFNKYVFEKYGVQMTDSLTISRLAMNIFLKKYLKDFKLPVIKQNMYKDIKQSYFGGITEVYKPYGENLYYYDVNSLYPYASLNSMPGSNCTYIERSDINIDTLFGFYYCEIETTDNYLGLLPVHRDFELIMPNGKWNGWYFSEQLKFAQQNGYKVKVTRGYSFNREDNVFNHYVSDLYKVKSNNTGSIKVIAKSLLNNLLGRFGLNVYKPVTKIVNEDTFNFIISAYDVNSFTKISDDDDYLITYYPEVNKNTCISHNLDYTKVLNSNKVNVGKLKEFNDVSLSTASAVTAYARIHMGKIKLDIINKGGQIYYSDTDSIVTDISLDEKIVGKDIGQFKLEYKVKKGFFISSKLYFLVLHDAYVTKKIRV